MKPRAKGVEATVVAVKDDNVFFDIGQKIEGVLAASELRDEKGLIEVKPGNVVLVSVAGRNEEGYYQLSLIKVERPKDWSGLQKAFEEKLIIVGTVTGVIKGGLICRCRRTGLHARFAQRSPRRPLKCKPGGQEISCRIIKLDVAEEDVVVDRRAVARRRRAKATGSPLFGELRRAKPCWRGPQPDRLWRFRRHRRSGRPATCERTFPGPGQ